MAEHKKTVVELRCVCGQHYRVRNAKPGFRTECPECGSLLEVTEGDLHTTFAADGSIELHADQTEAKAAIPLPAEELRPASKGARIGLTGGIAYAHPEAQLYSAMAGRPLDAAMPSAVGEAPDEPPPQQQRAFVPDLIASFYFAGRMGNLQNASITAFGASLIFVIGGLLGLLAGSSGLMSAAFFVLMIPAYAFTVLYVVQFYWLVLLTTAGGDDDIPWFATDWDFWSDGIKPLLTVLWVSACCSLPAYWVYAYMPTAVTFKVPLACVLLVLGWGFWPVAVMSVALGNSILFIRPDWLVRCIVGIGPVYLVAWLLVICTLVAWWLYAFVIPSPAIPGSVAALRVVVVMVYRIVAMALNIYFGYVLFRMLGLIFRHFRTRFPWKY